MAIVSTLSQPVTLTPTSTHQASTICSNDDDDNNDTLMYILIAIVTAGLLVIAVIAGVIMCRCRYGRMCLSKSSDPLIPSNYGSINAAPAVVAIVDNDLYGQPELQ